jgi:hypothetical protein
MHMFSFTLDSSLAPNHGSEVAHSEVIGAPGMRPVSGMPVRAFDERRLFRNAGPCRPRPDDGPQSRTCVKNLPGDQPFTAPTANPETTHRCSKKKTTTTGKVIKIDIAAKSDHGTWLAYCPWNE